MKFHRVKVNHYKTNRISSSQNWTRTSSVTGELVLVQPFLSPVGSMLEKCVNQTLQLRFYFHYNKLTLNWLKKKKTKKKKHHCDSWHNSNRINTVFVSLHSLPDTRSISERTSHDVQVRCSDPVGLKTWSGRCLSFDLILKIGQKLI